MQGGKLEYCDALVTQGHALVKGSEGDSEPHSSAVPIIKLVEQLNDSWSRLQAVISERHQLLTDALAVFTFDFEVDDLLTRLADKLALSQRIDTGSAEDLPSVCEGCSLELPYASGSCINHLV